MFNNLNPNKSNTYNPYIGFAEMNLEAIAPNADMLQSIIGEPAKMFDTDYKKQENPYTETLEKRFPVWVSTEDVRPFIGLNLSVSNTPRVTMDGVQQYAVLTSGTYLNKDNKATEYNIFGFRYLSKENLGSDPVVGQTYTMKSKNGNDYNLTLLFAANQGDDEYYTFIHTVLGYREDKEFLADLEKNNLLSSQVFAAKDTKALENLTNYIVEHKLTFTGILSVDQKGRQSMLNKTRYIASGVPSNYNVDVLSKEYENAVKSGNAPKDFTMLVDKTNTYDKPTITEGSSDLDDMPF